MMFKLGNFSAHSINSPKHHRSLKLFPNGMRDDMFFLNLEFGLITYLQMDNTSKYKQSIAINCELLRSLVREEYDNVSTCGRAQ